MGPPHLGPTFCVLSALAAAMVCIVTLAASPTTCSIISFAFDYSFAMFCICILSADVCLFETFTPDTI